MIVFPASFRIGASHPIPQKKNAVLVAEILSKSAAYCEKVSRAALHFVCEERIRETISPASWRTRNALYQKAKRTEEYEYVYDYQLVNTSGRIEESRTLIEENGEKRNQKEAQPRTRRFLSLKTVYAAADFVGSSAQTLYSYEDLGEERVLGRRAYRLGSRPKVADENSRSYGEIWIDKTTFAVLKIEREPESTEGFAELRETAARKGLWPILSVVHEFGVEKNGIR